MFKAGDYVLHSRQGPGRIVEVLPQHIVVRPRSGNVYKVNVDIAEQELVPVPSDGFIALLAQHDYSSERLLQQIPDIVERIMRDKRRRSISRKELIAELKPFLAREGKPFATWWKLAQQKLLESGRIAPDTKRKKTHLSLVGDILQPRPSAEAAARTANTTDVLQLARDISSTDNFESAKSVSEELTKRILSMAPVHAANERSSIELLLASSYIVDLLGAEAKAGLLDFINAQSVRQIPIPRDLEDDFVAALSRLTKAAGNKAVELAVHALNSPSQAVARKAFSVLNTDKNRRHLKSKLLDWLNAPDRVLPNIDLYLHDDFLAALRREDKSRLYRILSQRLFDNDAVRRFLARPDFAAWAVEGVEPGGSLAMLASKQLTAEARGAIIRAIGPEEQVAEILQRFVPDLDAALGSCVRQLDWAALSCNWNDLIGVVQRPGSTQTATALSTKCKDLLETASGVNLLHLIAGACALIECVDDADLKSGLERAVLNSTQKIMKNGVSETAIRPVITAISNFIENSKSELEKAAQRSEADARAVKDRAKAAEQETERLRNIVEMVKEASTQDRQQIRFEAKREIIMALLPVMDELERRTEGSQTERELFSDLKTVLAHAGVEQIGATGTSLPFDAHAQEFLAEPTTPVRSVNVVRAGYVLRDNGSDVIIRRALVRPAE